MTNWVQKIQRSEQLFQEWRLWVALSFTLAMASFIWGMFFVENRLIVWPLHDSLAVITLFFVFITALSVGTKKQYRAYAGLGLLLFSLAVFVGTLFFITNIKPWLTAFMVVGVVSGSWMIVCDRVGWPDAQDDEEVRRFGPGEIPECEKRKKWTECQTRRVHWLASVCVVGIALSLALYVSNHVQVVNEGQTIQWQTHLAANQFVTKPEDTLIAAAVVLNTNVQQLAVANPTLAVQTPTTVTSTLSRELQINPTGPNGRALDTIARELGVAPEEVALGFATIEVIPNQVLRMPSSGPRLWIDWALWGLVGVSTYLLIQAAHYYREIPEGRGDFINETPWYFTQMITGPIVAFVVLAILTRIDFSILGQTEDAAISVNLSQLPYDAMFGLAFLLGFFSRVARELLDLIAQSLFRSAWSAAVGSFEIQINGDPDEARIASSGRVVFTTKPRQSDVEWKVSEGYLDGPVYTAPDIKEAAQAVVVTAFINDGSHRKVSRTFEIVPYKYGIEVAEDGIVRADHETILRFTANGVPLTPAEEKEIYWHWDKSSEVEGIVPNEANGGEVHVGLKPGVDPPETEKEVIIIASYRGHAAIEHLVVAKRSLDEIVATVDDGSNGQRLNDNDPLLLGSKITLAAVHNLSKKTAEEIKWGEVGSNYLVFKPKSGVEPTGSQIDCTLRTDSKAAGHETTIVATLPNHDLRDSPSIRLKIATQPNGSLNKEMDNKVEAE